MGVSSKEKGLLKLVHPGGHVEIHRKPVMVAEIINKYPRHCIARPDVFKYPWIVVRPEKMLIPGEVFYIVPYHTMHNLLKAKGPLVQASSREKKSPNYHYGHNSPTRRNAPGKRRCRHQRNEQCSCVLVLLRTCGNNQDSDDGWSDTSYAAQTRIISKPTEQLHIGSSESLAFTQDSSLNARRSSPDESLEHCSSGFNSTLPEGNNTVLKSCFRKQDSIRKMLNLKVTFGSSIVLPNSSHESTSSMSNDDVASVKQ